jgi:hypothetical protein
MGTFIADDPKSWGRKAPATVIPTVPAFPATLPAINSVNTHLGITTYSFDGGNVVHLNAAWNRVEVIDTVTSQVNLYDIAMLAATPQPHSMPLAFRLAWHVAMMTP